MFVRFFNDGENVWTERPCSVTPRLPVVKNRAEKQKNDDEFRQKMNGTLSISVRYSNRRVNVTKERKISPVPSWAYLVPHDSAVVPALPALLPAGFPIYDSSSCSPPR